MSEVVEVRLDTQGAQSDIEEMTEALGALTEMMEQISAWDVGGVAVDLSGIAEDLKGISELLANELDGNSWLSTLSEIVSLAEGLVDLYPIIDKLKGPLGELKDVIVNLYNGIFGEAGLLAGTSTGAIIGVATAVVLAVTIIIQNLDLMKAKILEVWDGHLKPLGEGLHASFSSMGESISRIWNGLLRPLVDWVIAVFEPLVTAAAVWVIGAVEVILSVVSDLVDGSYEKLAGVIQSLSGVFVGDLEVAGEGISSVFESIKRTVGDLFVGIYNVGVWLVNGLIGIFHSLLDGALNLFGGIAGFFGDIFGKDWGGTIEIDAPYQVPYLAKGAVLPANRPFLAMVGDQRHGTNVEAPLATIQEAVALVMGDQVEAMMAGFRDVVREQQALRAAVEGIEVGDDVIGRAAVRYGQRMAVVRGSGM